MDLNATRTLVAEILADIAPEVDVADAADNEDLRQALDLDSMDYLNVIVGLHERTGIDVPEADYPKLYTLAGIAAYF
ncbi:MAG: acyl carrier protein [Gammaproteobacteria bacterium]